MKRLILLNCLILFILCPGIAHKYVSPLTHVLAGRNQLTTKTTSSDQAIDLIANLPEVREEQKQFFKATKRHILLTLENDSQKDGYYLIGVVQDMTDHYFHLWYFKLQPKTDAIFYWDIASDKMIPYSKWRKNIANAKL